MIADSTKWGGWSLDRDVFDLCRAEVPVTEPMLIIGSGPTVPAFAEFWDVTCVEHDPKYIQRGVKTVLCDILGQWYNAEQFDAVVGLPYRCIILDGPPGGTSVRSSMMTRVANAFFMNITRDCLWVIDDTHRADEALLAHNVARAVDGIECKHMNRSKSFSVIIPRGIK